MIAPLVHDLEKDYLEKEIGYEAAPFDREIYEIMEADIESLNELMELEKCQN